MLPALVAAIGSVYSVGKSYDSIRYWNDYRKNTGYSPKYPFSAGYYDTLGYTNSALWSYGTLYNNYSKLYRPTKLKSFNPMYG